MKKNIKHLFLLTGLATGCIYGINKFIDSTSEIKNLLHTNSGHYFEWRYGSIFYTKHGKGSPILLIHDLHPASSSFEWIKLIQKLEKTHTVYAIDLLGCGHSDKPNLTYTNYMYVQLITDFAKKIIGERTNIIATGDSCSFALMAANMEHTVFGKLFFISPPSLDSLQKNPSKKNNFLKNILETPVVGTFFYNILMMESNIDHLFEEEYYQKKELISVKMKDTYYESAHTKHSGGRYLLGSILGNYTNINIIPALKRIENPIFLIGNRETDESFQILDSYIKYDERIETAYISNCKKLPQLEAPDKLYKILCMLDES